MIKIETIEWAVVHEYHWISYQAELYRPYISALPINPYYSFLKKPIEYDQKKDKSCVVFSDMAMISYNCNLEFSDEEWREMWQEHQGNRWGDIFKTSRELGQRFILNSFPIYLDTPECDMYLKKQWSLQVEVWCDPKWIEEWVLTWKITKVLPMKKGRYIHAMLLYRKSNWEKFLQNSWRWVKNIWGHNIFNITSIYDECVKIWLIRPYWMAILPYFHKWQTVTLKDHTRAVKRLWVEIVWDVWDTFKNKFAKVDWKIDKLN
jgi:hypothetical protein